MLRLVRHVRAEVPANNAMPRRVVLFVELLLDEGRNVIVDVVFPSAAVAQSTASCCMSSVMSVFLITALRSS